MKKLVHRLPLFLFSILLGLCIGVARAEQFAQGRAIGIDSGELLYTEQHRWDEKHHAVKYLLPDGSELADTEVDFSHSLTSPAFTQTYAATQGNPETQISPETQTHSQTQNRPETKHSEGARWDGTTLILFNGRRERAVDFNQPLVINAGFFHFVRAHWDELNEGKIVGFNFALPDRMTTVALRVRSVSAEDSGIDNGATDWRYFRVEAASRVLRWVVAPLNVAFNEQRRLMVFRGAANVKLKNGSTPQVSIRFYYSETAPQEASP